METNSCDVIAIASNEGPYVAEFIHHYVYQLFRNLFIGMNNDSSRQTGPIIAAITDQIFTRMGAVNDLAAGQSTFMVEIAETANILNRESNLCLVLLDKIRRGTATFNGLSLLWAISENLATGLGAAQCSPPTFTTQTT